MKILVTGCGGDIGKYLIKKLLESYPNCIIYGVDKEKKIENLKAKFFVGINDARLKLASVDLLKEIDVCTLPDVDYIFHLAAINGTALFYEIPWDVYINSIQPTINLLNHYKDRNLERFIYTSSSEVYASLTDLGVNGIPTSESAAVGFSDVTNPRWSYGGAKLSGELALIAASNQFNLKFSIIRYHNVYGNNMSLNHVIPDFIERGKKGKFVLYGAENVRSFLYIDDAIDATILVASSKKAINRIVNIGSSEMVTMRHLGEKLMKIFGWEGKVIENDAPSGSTLIRCPNIDFLCHELGFEQKYTLDMGLRKLVL